jgi:quaternary ammonium compound-resistance protein SugE
MHGGKVASRGLGRQDEPLDEKYEIAIFAVRGRPLLPGFPSGRPGPPWEELSMTWVYLVIAGVLEVVWAYSMKQSDGFTRLLPTIVTITTMLGSFALLALAMRTLPLGTAYMIWTGIGAVGAFAVGIVMLGEAVSPLRVASAVLIVAGMVMMKLSSSA